VAQRTPGDGAARKQDQTSDSRQRLKDLCVAGNKGQYGSEKGYAGVRRKNRGRRWHYHRVRVEQDDQGPMHEG